jgi:hypothetical protein
MIRLTKLDPDPRRRARILSVLEADALQVVGHLSFVEALRWLAQMLQQEAPKQRLRRKLHQRVTENERAEQDKAAH